MAISSSLVMELPAAVPDVTVIDNLEVAGRNPFNVDLRLSGIMNRPTTVTVTCTTPKTNIVEDKGVIPDLAFGTESSALKEAEFFARPGSAVKGHRIRQSTPRLK